MSRAFSLLLTIVFLGAQMLSFAHAAEHGSDEHEHEDTECEICLSAKYQDCASPGAIGGTFFSPPRAAHYTDIHRRYHCP